MHEVDDAGFHQLGAFALSLGWPDYVIHGTDKPDGVGRRISHGCLRLYPEDIASLFELVEVGTPVTVIDQPVKVGWMGGELYLEVHPSQQQALGIEPAGGFSPEPLPELRSTHSSFVRLCGTGPQAGFKWRGGHYK